jgi:hypothetical protein
MVLASPGPLLTPPSSSFPPKTPCTPLSGPTPPSSIVRGAQAIALCALRRCGRPRGCVHVCVYLYHSCKVCKITSDQKKLRFGTTSTADFGRPRSQPFVYPGTVSASEKFDANPLFFWCHHNCKRKNAFFNHDPHELHFVRRRTRKLFFSLSFFDGVAAVSGDAGTRGGGWAGGGGAHPILRGPGSLFTVKVSETVFAVTMSGNP